MVVQHSSLARTHLTFALDHIHATPHPPSVLAELASFADAVLEACGTTARSAVEIKLDAILEKLRMTDATIADLAADNAQLKQLIADRFTQNADTIAKLSAEMAQAAKAPTVDHDAINALHADMQAQIAALRETTAQTVAAVDTGTSPTGAAPPAGSTGPTGPTGDAPAAPPPGAL